MKLKFKIAKSTSLRSEDILNKILLVIEEHEYGIVNVTNNHVSFDNNKKLIVGNWEFARRVHNGSFEIINNGNTNIVVLEYLPIHLFEIIWVVGVVVVYNIFAISVHAYIATLFTIPFAGQLVYKHYNLKSRTEEMLTKVTT